MINKKIAIIVNAHRFTVKHRLPLARQLLKEGNELIFIVPDNSDAKIEIVNNNFNFRALNLNRSGKYIDEIKSMYSILTIFRQEKPDLIINATIKPVLYGTVCGFICGIKDIINLITGLGSVFSAQDKKISILTIIVKIVYNIIFKTISQKVIFQNEDDKRALLYHYLNYKAKFFVVNGSGVSTGEYTPYPFPKEKVILFVGRMIYEKGIDSFIKSAIQINQIRHDIKFVLVGPLDFGNPSAINEKVIKGWTKNSNIEYWGEKESMNEIYRQSSIVVLPSIREGFPKIIMEAGLSGRPVIATNVPGCKNAVIDGVTGYLIPFNDHNQMSDKILNLIDDVIKMKSFGMRGSDYIKKNFSEDVIIPEYLKIFES